MSVPGQLRHEGTRGSGGLHLCARPGALDEGGAASAVRFDAISRRRQDALQTGRP